MKRLTKLAILSAMSFASCAAVVAATFSFPDTFESAYAVDCTHEGNHYTLLIPSTSKAGTKEYWVCCKCHEHFTTLPNGTWNDAGTAPVTYEGDDRYIPKVTSTKTGYTDAQGITYSLDGTTITGYTPVPGVNELVIPEGVTIFENKPFKGKTNITKVTLPESLTEIGLSYFENCTNLKTVVIGSSVDVIKVTYNKNGFTKYSEGAFQGCSSLEYLIIPATVNEIQPYTFRDVNKNCKLYCEVATRPTGWKINTPDSGDDWNVYSNSKDKPKLKAYWLGEWYLDADGIPHPNN